ncbi:MAG: asparagine synthase (glutamine-hydrolyzing) [Candidatus Cloacimonetes bacterium]|nr:asparagine synthase (glutamine-hydrolyzing) [Candidatus Cloacimonadota bacterium]
MCGISGIISLDGKKQIDALLLQEMTQRVKHRGPDDEGYLLANIAKGSSICYAGTDSPEDIKRIYPVFSGSKSSADISTAQLGFGFRRLSILELKSKGHQPMSDEKLKLSISFNGEIYNYLELKAQLQDLGYVFNSGSDTEVILKAYHAWGDNCVEKFIGMWAFALWDATNKRLFCSRDRYGIKPFYYCIQDGFLFWGSEMKQLLATPIPKTLNTAMIWRSMKINALMVYDNQTYWQNIHSLLPGHNLSVVSGVVEIKEYYHLDVENFESSQLSFSQAVEEYQRLFLDSIALQMRSDVQIGASLSGGMDSSAIVCSAMQQQAVPMPTFSSFYADTPALDERKWIETIVQHSGCTSELISPTSADALKWWIDATYYNDLPIAAGFVSQYAVMQAAHARGVKVLLSGQGSDELNGGYKHAAYRYFADQIRTLSLGKLSKELPEYLQGSQLLTKLGNMAKISLSALLPESSLYKLEFNYYRFDPFSTSFKEAAHNNNQEGILQKITDIKASRMSNFLYNMMHNTSVQTLLHFEDRLSMANSVESRVPFLDNRLVDFVFSLPSAYKTKPPETKLLHRAAMKEFIPAEIYNRKDKGIFSSPFYQQWMRDGLKPFIVDLLGSNEFRRRGIWNLPSINRQWQLYLAGDNRPAEMLYNVIALELWFQRFP